MRLLFLTMHAFPQNWNKTFTSLPSLFSEAENNNQDTDQEAQAALGLGGGHQPAGGSSRGDCHFGTQVTASLLLK